MSLKKHSQHIDFARAKKKWVYTLPLIESIKDLRQNSCSRILYNSWRTFLEREGLYLLWQLWLLLYTYTWKNCTHLTFPRLRFRRSQPRWELAARDLYLEMAQRSQRWLRRLLALAGQVLAQRKLVPPLGHEAHVLSGHVGRWQNTTTRGKAALASVKSAAKHALLPASPDPNQLLEAAARWERWRRLGSPRAHRGHKWSQAPSPRARRAPRHPPPQVPLPVLFRGRCD